MSHACSQVFLKNICIPFLLESSVNKSTVKLWELHTGLHRSCHGPFMKWRETNSPQAAHFPFVAFFVMRHVCIHKKFYIQKQIDHYWNWIFFFFWRSLWWIVRRWHNSCAVREIQLAYISLSIQKISNAFFILRGNKRMVVLPMIKALLFYCCKWVVRQYVLIQWSHFIPCKLRGGSFG